jgi:hypothetical protein
MNICKTGYLPAALMPAVDDRPVADSFVASERHA